MRPTSARSANTRLRGGLTSPVEGRTRKSSNGAYTADRPSRDSRRSDYTDLDRAPMPIENYLTQNRRSGEAAKRRARREPEELLTEDQSSFAVKSLPKVTLAKTSAAEESILKKWEAWSTQMGTQLALEGAVPATSGARATSRNSSFRSTSQLSNNSFSKPRPESAHGFSPRSQSGRRSVSRCSSRSRQSSLASTVVEPFRVGDRMTASAERRRQRPKSTQASRELLFRRALGLEDDNEDFRNASTASVSKNTAPTPGPLVAPSKSIGINAHTTETRRTLPVGSQADQAAAEDPRHPSQAGVHHLQSTDTTVAVGVLKEGPICEADSIPVKRVSPEPLAAEPADSRGEKWLKKSVALLHSKDHPFTKEFKDEVRPNEGKFHDTSAVSKDFEFDSPPQKWHLPLGEAAQMTCGRIVERPVSCTEIPLIGYRGNDSQRNVSTVDRVRANTVADVSWVEWPIDRSSVTVLFVDHHEDDDQLSAYGVEVSSREDCPPDVLPDWNESRKRFAPTALADSQPPR